MSVNERTLQRETIGLIGKILLPDKRNKTGYWTETATYVGTSLLVDDHFWNVEESESRSPRLPGLENLRKTEA